MIALIIIPIIPTPSRGRRLGRLFPPEIKYRDLDIHYMTNYVTIYVTYYVIYVT